jgi:hypothetical protein
MCHRIVFVTVALASALTFVAPGARAFDETRYLDFVSQWIRVGDLPWDPSKPVGLGQQAPLTPEYQAVFEASLADQAEGGHGNDRRFTCRSSGMPRNMTAVYPIEIVINPKITYILGEYWMPRRIYTDGRDWPSGVERAFAGYSIGRWIDEDGSGRYAVLEVETRNFKGPRDFEEDGLPLHQDNETIIKERIYLDNANPDVLHDEITTIDRALTRPWTVVKTYRREKSPSGTNTTATRATTTSRSARKTIFSAATAI